MKKQPGHKSHKGGKRRHAPWIIDAHVQKLKRMFPKVKVI